MREDACPITAVWRLIVAAMDKEMAVMDSRIQTQAALAEIAERAEKATEGPWEAIEMPSRARLVVPPGGDVSSVCSITAPSPLEDDRSDHNWQFITHARTDIPALLAHAAALQAEVSLPQPATPAPDRGEAERWAERMVREHTSLFVRIYAHDSTEDAEALTVITGVVWPDGVHTPYGVAKVLRSAIAGALTAYADQRTAGLEAKLREAEERAGPVWRDAKKEKPATGGDLVLVRFGNRDTDHALAYWNCGWWLGPGEEMSRHVQPLVTHWQPLPLPPAPAGG